MATNSNDIQINYLAYDYNSIKNSLFEYAQTYYPNTYTDFTDSSPVGFFSGMVSYVGDLMSFYIDKRYQESILQTATDRKNVVELSKFLGYNHRPSAAAVVDLSVYQLIPKHATNGIPDFNYALKIKEGMTISAKSTGTIFKTLEDVDFAVTSSTEMSVYDTTYQNDSYFILKKNVRAISADNLIETFTFGSAAPFVKIKLTAKDILSIENCTDSDGNIWYEVPYLAQDTIAEAIENTTKTNSLYTNFSNSTPFLINLKKTTKRFIRRTTSDNETELIFGAGSVNLQNEDIIPTQTALSELFIDSSIADRTIDNRNFLRLDTLGESPANTVLTITYSHGGGLFSNTTSNDINIVLFKNTEFFGSGLDSDKSDFVLNSFGVNNLLPAIGGRGPETTEEIKQNALSYFSGQNRIVTKEDYEVRSLTLDAKFGSIDKVFAVKDTEDPTTPEIESGTISLYCLSKNADNTLTTLNNATKYNLKKYLEQYRMLTDNIAIRDAYIINIGVEFSISTTPNYNASGVLFDCLSTIRQFFDTAKYKIGQPIIKSDIHNLIYQINGVKSVNYINITNKRNGNYSNIYYNIDNATRNEIIYSSLDPAIFEVKFPNSDIQGMVV